MNFLSVLDKISDPETRRQIMNLRTKQRGEYIRSVAAVAGLGFWSEVDDLVLDRIDSDLAKLCHRSKLCEGMPTMESATRLDVGETLVDSMRSSIQPEEIPSFLTENIPQALINAVDKQKKSA